MKSGGREVETEDKENIGEKRVGQKISGQRGKRKKPDWKRKRDKEH